MGPVRGPVTPEPGTAGSQVYNYQAALAKSFRFALIGSAQAGDWAQLASALHQTRSVVIHQGDQVVVAEDTSQ